MLAAPIRTSEIMKPSTSGLLGGFGPQLISILGGWPSRVRFGNSTRSAPLHSVADGTFRYDLY